MSRPTAIVLGVGAGEGLGAAVCRKFASEGHHVYVSGRTQSKIDAVTDAIVASGGSAEAVQADASRVEDVTRLFEHAFEPSTDLGLPEVVVFNVGNNRRMPLLDISPEEFEEFWRGGCFAGFLVGREAARRLLPLGRGTIIFTGASASLRGKAGFAHFASSKAGLRMVSQSMAREFGPRGIHVAHVVVDGGINGERLRTLRPERTVELREDGMLDPAAIAENYWHLHCQQRTAWTQEIDLRPYKEMF